MEIINLLILVVCIVLIGFFSYLLGQMKGYKDGVTMIKRIYNIGDRK